MYPKMAQINAVSPETNKSKPMSLLAMKQEPSFLDTTSRKDFLQKMTDHIRSVSNILQDNQSPLSQNIMSMAHTITYTKEQKRLTN